MELRRQDLQQALQDFADEGSGLVIGAPGVGKTYLLRALVNRRLERREPVLYLPVDRLVARDEATLASELRAQSLESLVNSLFVTEDSRAVCVVDAFDAARSADQRDFWISIIRSLLRELGERGTLIVSARSYDAEKSADLQELFPGGQAHSVLASVSCRHFPVPALSAHEVREVLATTSGISSISQLLSPRLITILNTPFKLWLLERVIAGGATSPQLTGLESEIGLLQLFWNQRVAIGSDSEAKQLLLMRLSNGMVEGSTLTVAAANYVFPDETETLSALLSAEILVPQGAAIARLSFAHNILFDFAVATLVVPREPEEHLRFLEKDEGRPIFLRPSLHYFYALLWLTNRPLFWSILRALIAETTPTLRLIARLVPVAVIASESQSPSDVDPLTSPGHFPEANRERVVEWLLQAIRTFGVRQPAVWAEVSVALARRPHAFIGDLALVLRTLLDEAKDHRQSVEHCGEAARLLLKWVWKNRTIHPWLDRLGAHQLVHLVVQTFDTNSEESKGVLLPALDLTQEEAFPIDYLFRLSVDAHLLERSDPEFLSALYSTVFTHSETGAEPTPLGGHIVRLVSNRRQDFDSCRYTLAEFFPKFLVARPRLAFLTGLVAVNSFVIEKHVLPFADPEGGLATQWFAFADGRSQILRDGSHIWGEDLPHELELQNLLEVTTALSNDALEQDALLSLFRDEARVAILWKRLLELVSIAPRHFATEHIADLLSARPLLTSPDVLVEIGTLLETSFVLLEPEQRARVEQAVMDVGKPGDGGDDPLPEGSERIRNRLLARVSPAALVTERARELREELEDSDSLPPNDPLVRFTSTSEPYTTEEWLEEQGADPSHPETTRILSLTAPLEAFASQWLNKIPDADATGEAFTQISEARSLLSELDLDPPVLHSAWTRLAASAKTLARIGQDLSPEELTVLEDVLISAASIPSPYTEDQQFQQPAWSPTARTEAAQGLPWLALVNPNEAIISAITSLANDPVPSVRYLTAIDLWRFRSVDAVSYWRLIDQRIVLETNPTVLDGLCYALGRAVNAEPSLVESALRSLVELNRPSNDASVWEDVIDLIFFLSFRHKSSWANEFLESITNNPDPDLLHWAVQRSLQYLRPDSLKHPKSLAPLAAAWLIKGLTGVKHLAGSPAGVLDPNDPVLTTIYNILDAIVSRLEFSVSPPQDRGPVLDQDELIAFQRLTAPVVDSWRDAVVCLPEQTVPAATTHHLMKFLRKVVGADPAWALSTAHAAVKAGEKAGYALDAMAIPEVVRLVETLLADHRSILRGAALRHLVDLLDVFVQSGWPEALQLVWRLDEVFR